MHICFGQKEVSDDFPDAPNHKSKTGNFKFYLNEDQTIPCPFKICFSIKSFIYFS